MAKLAVFVIGDASSAKAAMAETGVAAEGMAGTVDAAAGAIKGAFLGTMKAFLPLVAAFSAGKFLKGAIDSAENLKKAQDSLAVSIQHTGGDMTKLKPQYDATAKAAAQYGVNVVDATTGLARATLLTGKALYAQRAYKEALVISKATGKDFNAVLTATSKAQEGSTGSLGRYGILLPKVTTAQVALKAANANATVAQIAHAKAIDTATAAAKAQVLIMQRFGGQAAANTNASDKLRANFENLQTTIGEKLLPAFNAIVQGINYVVAWLSSPGVSSALHSFGDGFMQVMQPIIDWVQKNWPEIKNIIVQTLSTIESVIQTTVGVVREIWTRFGKQITEIVKIAWDFVKGTVLNGMEVIRGVIDVISGIIHGRWGQVWKGITEIVGGALREIWNILSTAVKTLGVIAARVGDAIWTGLKAGGEAVINWIIGKINVLIDAYNKVFGWLTGNIAAIQALGPWTAGDTANLYKGKSKLIYHPPPAHAMGGIATRATLGIFGEAGPEALIPLNRLSQFMGAGKSGGGLSVTVGPITVHGSADAAFAKTLAAELATQLRGGRVPAFQQAIAAI